MLISMIVPCYQGNKYLEKIDRMASANAKMLPEDVSLELVIVNDSPWIELDKSKLSEEEYTLKIIINEKNSGIHKSRANGIKAAAGDYILMLDQDDIITDDCFASHLQTIGNTDVSVSNGYKRNDGIDIKIYKSKKQQLKITKLFWYLYLENRILSPGQCLSLIHI